MGGGSCGGSVLVDDVLPRQSYFLRNYCNYAAACSDAPPLYHIGVGLTILSAAVARRVVCPWMAGRSLMPNLYTLLVGPSRSSRKTGSMDIGIDLLQAADTQLVCPIPGSYEEMIAQVRRRPEGLFIYREFAHLLKTTQKGYGEPIRTILMDLYDWPPHRPYIRNLKKGSTVIDAPICISMLGGIATDLLYRYCDLEEWTGGFFARMLMLYGEREECRLPLTWPAAHNHLTTALHGMMQWQIPPCGGFAPDAWTQLEEWTIWQDKKTDELPARVRHFAAGMTTMAAKIALLYAVDSGEPQAGPGWQISCDTLQRAIWFVHGPYQASVVRLGEKLTIGFWEQDRQRVLDGIDSEPRGILRYQLIRMVKMDLELFERILNSLKEEKLILQQQHPHGLGVMYRRMTETEARAQRAAPTTPTV
jgi:hypothetical protein